MQLIRVLIALTVVGASAATLAGEGQGRDLAPSSLLFSLVGPELGIFPIAVDTTQGSALNYNHAAGEVQLLLGNPAAGQYLDPLFCFNFSNGSNAVTLEAQDANNHVVLAGIPLSSNLNYILGNDEIRYNLSTGVQCFYYGALSGEFGLFGRAPSGPAQNPSGQIFSDRFEGDERISIEYSNLPGFRNPGDAVTYDITISNDGNVNQPQVAFQELFPRVSENFDATLTPGTWSCTASGTGSCPAPASSEDPNSLRFSNLNLPVGASITFTVNRTVRSDATVGGIIDLHAGIVAGSGSFAAFDATSAEIVVVGSANSVFASNASGMAGQPASIEVSVLDGDNNPIPFAEVDLVSADGLAITPASAQTSDVTGFALFQASSTVAGSYAPQFSASSVGSATANVSISAAAPDDIGVTAVVDQAIADGQDQVIMTVLVEDSFGNPVSAVEVEVADGGGLSDIDSLDPFTDTSGTAVFTATSTNAATYAVSFSAAGIVSDTTTVGFVADDPAGVTFFIQPQDVVSGAAMSPVVVRTIDSQGNWVDSDNSTSIQLRLYQNDNVIDTDFANGMAVNGETTFSGLTLTTTGSDYSFLAVAILPDFTPATELSETFAVTTSAP